MLSAMMGDWCLSMLKGIPKNLIFDLSPQLGGKPRDMCRGNPLMVVAIQSRVYPRNSIL